MKITNISYKLLFLNKLQIKNNSYYNKISYVYPKNKVILLLDIYISLSKHNGVAIHYNSGSFIAIWYISLGINIALWENCFHICNLIYKVFESIGCSVGG